MTDKREVKYDDLDYLPEGIFLLDGKPFTGVTVDRYPDGHLWCEVPFKDGCEHGISRDWYPTGQLSSETPYQSGIRHGVERKWFDDGSLRVETVFEFGWMMSKKVLSQDGEVVEVYERPPSDKMYQHIVKRRAQSPAGP